MADLVETEQWEDGIYQLETTDPVEGGADGVDNVQARQLANRTAYLKQQLENNTAQATETVKGIAKIATQAEVDAGVNDLKFVTAKKLKARENSLFLNALVGGIGYQKLPGGLILQWSTGFDTSVGDQGQTIVFPITFPTTILSVNVSTVALSFIFSDLWFQEMTYSRTKSSVQVVSQWSGVGSLSGKARPVVWALGY